MQNSHWKIKELVDGVLFSLFIFNFSFLIFLSGCAYSFSGSSVPSHLKTIAIPLFEDQSGFGEPGLKENFTTSLINLFVNDNSLQMAERNTADSILEGTIISVQDVPQVITPGEQVTTRRVTINVHVTYQDLKLRKKVWEKDFSNWGEYSTSSETRTTALNQAVSKVTQDILIETVSGW
ncbi:MAG: LptE family protein [Bacteroidota bacterium]